MKPKMLLAILLLAGCAAPPPGVDQQGPPIELAGRVAGAPTACVPLRQGESLRVSENNDHTLIYGNGRTMFANYLGQCRIDRDDLLVTLPSAGSYCRGDVVKTVDRSSGLPGSACILGNFVPYTL